MDLISQLVNEIGKAECVVIVIGLTICADALVHYYEFKNFKITRKDV